ncbi:MAG TPA: nucleoside hydrolase [Dermatophilaceae bacterium]|nr:nucleoside hydrolase [Dermatophilaceae bacterium]
MRLPSRLRVISDNDYSGDPDGLVQLVHHLLSPSVQLTTVIGSHLSPGDRFDASSQTADNAAAEARTVLGLLDIDDVSVVAGSNTAMPDATTPIDNDAARAIIDEAMRDDPRPLYACFGAGLTSLASAWLLEPRIANRLTAIWIGGPEYPHVTTTSPDPLPSEYNTRIDIPAAQVIFNQSDIALWQIPRDTYRQVIVPFSDMETWPATAGKVGAHLYDRLAQAAENDLRQGHAAGETYVLGDSPLVTFTALQTMFHPDPASSGSMWLPSPHLLPDGSYRKNQDGQLAGCRDDRRVRVFGAVDTWLTMTDLHGKLRRAAVPAP